MASHLVFLALAFWASLTLPAFSLTCSSQNLTSSAGKSPYASCLDLPVLDSYLHYSYNATNSSLSVAFVAAPASPGGWIAWAINPTAEGMVGSQAFIAFRSKGGAPVVKTYNVSSYRAINEGKLSFDAWDLRAESIGDKLAIFASVKVPAGSEKVNQVWQIGEKVTNGQPEKHSFDAPNLNSKGALRFSGDEASPSPAPAPARASGGASSAGENAAGNTGSRKTSVSTGVNLVILASLGILFIL